MRRRRFALVFSAVLSGVAFVTWTIWGALTIGQSNAADARTAAAITLGALIPAVAFGLLYAFEDRL